MKKLFYQNRKLLIVAIFPLIFTVVASLVKMPYDVVSPAYINEVDNVIEIDNDYVEKGTFNTVSVYSYERVSLLQYLIALFDRKTTISRTYKVYNLSNVEGYRAGTIQKNVSINNALIAGYSLANYFGFDASINYHYEGYIVDTYYTYLTPNSLKIGDIITKVGDYELAGDKSIGSVFSQAEAESDSGVLVEVKRNKDLLKFTITRNKYIDYYGNEKTGFGFSGYDYYVIDNATPTYKINKSQTIGPSGGLLQALMVFNALTTNFDITNGMKIVGTGTIDNYGSVGEIGGIYQKIITADVNNANLFFVPVYRQNGYTEKYVKISKANTWMIGSYDTNIAVSRETIPYLNSDNVWSIKGNSTNIRYYGQIITIYDESNLNNESNYLEAYRSYKNLKNSKMLFVPVSTLEEAVIYLSKNTEFENIIQQKRNAYELIKRNNNLTYDEWISSLEVAN